MATSSTATHLHFGGSLTKNSRLGMKPQPGVTFKKQMRYEKAIRLENAGFGEQAISAMLCISLHRFKKLKQEPDYLAARIKITHGIILDQEGSLAQIKEQRKELLAQSLPAALQVLANELLAPAVTLAERKHKVEVARDLLDREGTFAKVSRTEVKPVDVFSFEEADKASHSVLEAIRAVAPATKPRADRIGSSALGVADDEIAATIATSEAFASGETIDASAQQQALDKLEAEAAESAPELLEFLPPATKEIQ